jgi:outer membrane murein-binding lipoprotein Lpp
MNINGVQINPQEEMDRMRAERNRESVNYEETTNNKKLSNSEWIAMASTSVSSQIPYGQFLQDNDIVDHRKAIDISSIPYDPNRDNRTPRWFRETNQQVPKDEIVVNKYFDGPLPGYPPHQVFNNHLDQATNFIPNSNNTQGNYPMPNQQQVVNQGTPVTQQNQTVFNRDFNMVNQENNQLRNTINELNATIERQTNNINSLMHEANATLISLNSANSRIKELNEQIVKDRKIYLEGLKTLSVLEEEVRNFKRLCSSKDVESAKQFTIIEELKKEREELMLENMSLYEEVEGLKTKSSNVTTVTHFATEKDADMFIDQLIDSNTITKGNKEDMLNEEEINKIDYRFSKIDDVLESHKTAIDSLNINIESLRNDVKSIGSLDLKSIKEDIEVLKKMSTEKVKVESQPSISKTDICILGLGATLIKLIA